MTLVDPNGPQAHRRLALLRLTAALDVADERTSASETDYVAAFARFLGRNVAAGDPADDMRATYGVHMATWLAWRRGVGLDVVMATTEDVEDNREALLGAGSLPSTIAIKLTLVRRLYDAAIRAGPRQSNPAAGVAAPRSRRAAEDFGYLSEGDGTLRPRPRVTVDLPRSCYHHP